MFQLLFCPGRSRGIWAWMVCYGMMLRLVNPADSYPRLRPVRGHGVHYFHRSPQLRDLSREIRLLLCPSRMSQWRRLHWGRHLPLLFARPDLLGPEEEYEFCGNVPQVVFPTAAVRGKNGSELGRIGKEMRFSSALALSPAESKLSPLPCQKFSSRPTAAK